MTTPEPHNLLSRRDWAFALAIGGIALLVRWSSVVHGGGLHAILGYDEGVYFGAATALVHGLIPYRDFVLVHPPGSLVLLSPFALLGKLTTDSTGWAAARIFVMGIGAVNAALVFTIARRVSLVGGLTAGLLYAVWFPAVHVERTTMLEAFVLLSITMALWALRSPQEPTWRLLVAGVALGLGAGTKLWGLVPLVVIAAWLAVRRAGRSLAIVMGAALGSLALLLAPFLMVAHGRIVDLVVFAQIDRGRGGTHELDRLAHMFNVDLASLAGDQRMLVTAGLATSLLVVAACVLAWIGSATARLWVALLVVQWGVLLTVPVYFEGYSSFVAPALMLTVGAAVSAVWTALASWSTPWRAMSRGAMAAAIALIVLVNGYHAARSTIDLKPHLREIAESTANAHCVGSDSAGLLIVTDVLSRNIERGCATVIDFDGSIYAVAQGSNPQHLAATERRRASGIYQKGMRDYFAANDVVLIHRAAADAFDATTRLALHSRPLVYHQKGLRVFGQ